MFQRFASTAFVFGTLFTAAIPSAGLAQNHGGRQAGSNHSQSFAGGSRSYAPRGSSGGSRYSSGQSFASPRAYDGRREYSGGSRYVGRGYVAPRVYGRPLYRGYYRGGVYLGYTLPYGYAYDDYVYEPGYASTPGYESGPNYSNGPAPAPQACSEGAYDRNGTWVPSPNCYSGQQQYPQQPQNYNYDQQQYQQPQQNYDPNQARRYNR